MNTKELNELARELRDVGVTNRAVVRVEPNEYVSAKLEADFDSFVPAELKHVLDGDDRGTRCNINAFHNDMNGDIRVELMSYQ